MDIKQEDCSVSNMNDDDYSINTTHKEGCTEFIKEEVFATEISNDYEINLSFQDLTESVSINLLISMRLKV